MTKFELIPSEIIKVKNGKITFENDMLSVEEPLEIKISYLKDGQYVEKDLSITMRTPGHDQNLVYGFLFTEGIIHEATDVLEYVVNQEITSKTGLLANQVICKLASELKFNFDSIERHFYTTSSCGVCGKASIDAVKIACPIIVPQNKWIISHQLLYAFNQTLIEAQKNFTYSGGIHASALFNLEGHLLSIREDVGRHNALDKLIGEALMQNMIPLFDTILFLSGRASFELIQKASMAGIRMICAVGAPSSLAVDLAQELDITLVGFLRDNRFNIYAAPERIDLKS